MTTPAIIITLSVFFVILILHEICAVKVNAISQIDQQAFRMPRAKKMIDYMNESVDPCFDFYDFACGNWQTYYPATEDNPVTSPMIDLEDTINKELQVLLEEEVRSNGGQFERNIKAFYESCMDSDNASQTIRQAFLDFVKNNLGMPAAPPSWKMQEYNWITQVSGLRKKYGMDILIGLNIKPDIMNTRDTSQIYIGEPSTLIPKSICMEHDFNNSKYIELQTEITDNMAYWFGIDKNANANFANDLLDFETNLCRGMSEETAPDVLPNITKITLQELSLKFPSIMFSYFVSTSLGHAIHQTINLEHEKYFQHLVKLMRATPKPVIANYVMYRALYAISFPDETNRENRASLCVEECTKHFSKAIGEMFNRNHYHKETEKDIQELWEKLKAAFKTNIESQSWIEHNVRLQAIYKLNQMNLKFPNYYSDTLQNDYGSVHLIKPNFWQNIVNLLELKQKKEIKKLYPISSDEGDKKVEAFDINVGYNPMQYTIQMPLGLLQPPVYHHTAPYSYRYGILGYFIAREMVHGFDEHGWKYDDASAVRLWWDPNSTLAYKERAACFQDQYVSYDRKASDLSESELNENIRQIIADNGALNISFNAYLQWLEEAYEPDILYEETFTDVNYTNTQLFFISFAQNFCTSTYLEEEPIGFFPWDVANYLEKFQVNGLLWNMKEFSREFNCRPGTEMNPGDKCSIY